MALNLTDLNFVRAIVFEQLQFKKIYNIYYKNENNEIIQLKDCKLTEVEI